MFHRFDRFVVATLVGGLAVGAVAALGAVSLASGSQAAAADGAPPPDRASIEQLLAERPIKRTGQTRHFDLTVGESDWELVNGVSTKAITFNGTVPGPTIRVTEGDAVEVTIKNTLSEGTSVHWHGLHVPNDQDGVAGVTQEPIAPGTSYTYRFTAPHAGTFMYHAHGPNSREQIDRGLYAPFIIDPQGGDPLRPDAEYTLAIGNWMVGGEMSGRDAMSMAYDYFTINGKSYPATTPITATQGDLIRLRFINPSQTVHPMHLHGMDMAVVAKDGEPLATPQRLNVLDLAPGDTYDVVFRAEAAGTWLLHCHDLHHASNNGKEPGGLIVPITVTSKSDSPTASPASTAAPSETPVPGVTPAHTMVPGMTEMPGMGSMPGMDH